MNNNAFLMSFSFPYEHKFSLFLCPDLLNHLNPRQVFCDHVHFMESAFGYVPFGKILLIALSAIAVMDKDGFTPGFAEIIAPSIT